MVASEMHVDPKKLREFAEQLSSTLSYYKRTLDALDAKLSRLSSTWRDQEFELFAKEVRTTRRILEEFIQAGSEARRKLIEDAERVETYQRVNPN